MSRFRVILYDGTSTRGPNEQQAIIDDAKDIGGSEYANAAGEFFMTLPWNHPQINSIVPLERHYQAQRYHKTNGWQTIFRGIVDDFDASADEVIIYGTDYLGLLGTTITPSGTSYTSQFVGTIINNELTAARAESNSRVGFISIGTIDTTTTTVSALSSFQPRLDFISGLADILMSNGTTRAIIRVSPKTSLTPSFEFDENIGSDQLGVNLRYGGLVNDFRYVPGYADLATTINAIGQKREGASILYSTQTYANPATYGHIARPEFFIDVIDQAALDKFALRAARRAARIGKNVGLAIRTNQLGPDDGWAIGDSVPVYISRGLANVNAMYTIWGYEWTGKKDGSEDLFLSLLPKDE